MLLFFIVSFFMFMGKILLFLIAFGAALLGLGFSLEPTHPRGEIKIGD
jgi:hypothetical protein